MNGPCRGPGLALFAGSGGRQEHIVVRAPHLTLLTALFVAVALTAGLVITLVVAAGGVVLFLAARLLRRPVSASAQRAVRVANSSDVIEVTATEVPVDPPSR